MRYGIVSDIHSNLEALEAVLEDAERQHIDGFICLGDVVGYGANPNECVQHVQKLTRHVVVGNHDHAAVGLTDISYFNAHAKQAVVWTAKVLLPEHSRYLSGLPFTHQSDDLFFVHATASDPPAWNYLFSPHMALAEFDAFSGRCCFIGHSHQPVIFSQKNGGNPQRAERFALSSEGRYIVNVGSIGQPRDGDARACYAIFDNQEGHLQLRRVAYDVQTAQRKILQAGLPPILAIRLAHGQ
jgi:diadenosine tetraphosphatase ApaH/serine/threonine PP2A family protein phosphatase